MSSHDVISEAEKVISSSLEERDPHESSGLAVNHLIRECMHRRALDNLTVIFIGLHGFEVRFGTKTSGDRNSRQSSQNRKHTV
jgi:hypothetical protein